MSTATTSTSELRRRGNVIVVGYWVWFAGVWFWIVYWGFFFFLDKHLYLSVFGLLLPVEFDLLLLICSL